eukprot:SAG31_NODE_4278_length_3384_cov_1.471537_5_plen_63_part_01
MSRYVEGDCIVFLCPALDTGKQHSRGGFGQLLTQRSVDGEANEVPRALVTTFRQFVHDVRVE